MQQVLLIVQVLVAVGLIALVMLQQGRGADAGAAFGSGGSGTLFGSRGPATVLTRATAILAAVFFINSIALSYLAAQGVERRSVVERFEQAPPAGEAMGGDGPVLDVPAAGSDAPPGADDVPGSDGPPTQ